MNIGELTDVAGLDELIAAQPLPPFLQSWAWGDFQRQYGRRIWRLAARDGGRLTGAVLVVEHQLMLGQKYLYCPRGPVATTPEAATALLAAVKDLGARESAMYVKIDLPNYGFSFEPSQWPDDFIAGSTLQPGQTSIVDLRRAEPELLSAMHPKTRYNIRLAEKHGVTTRWSNGDDDFEKFMTLMRATATRQRINLHPDNYYQLLFTVLKQNEMAEIALAEYQGQVLAANLMIRHQHTTTYLHGASADEHKDLMAPHLLQWQAMRKAKSQGCADYDFWGVAPENSPDHKWQGITRFKKGFGGYIVKFPPAANAILQPSWYWAYRFAKRMRGGFDE